MDTKWRRSTEPRSSPLLYKQPSKYIVCDKNENYLQLRLISKQTLRNARTSRAPPAGDIDRCDSGWIRIDALTQFLAEHPQLTESISKDKQAEAAALKENATQKSSPLKNTTPASGKKSQAELSLDEEIAAYKADLNDTIDYATFENDILPSCNIIRTKLNKLFDSGVMNKAEFCRATGTNSNSLNKFLRQKGPFGGSKSAVWRSAYVWFQQREVMGLKMPDTKKRQREESKKDTADRTPSKASTTKALPDISDIHLEGEETDEVPIYDDCDEIRGKINVHMKIPSVTQAQFCRDIYAQFKAPTCKGIQSKQLSDFRKAKGSDAGAKSSVFYGAYVYFEKMRIAQKKPVTKHRDEMTVMYPGGIPRDRDDRTTWIIAAA